MKTYSCDVCGKSISLEDRNSLALIRSRKHCYSSKLKPLEFDLCSECFDEVKSKMFEASKKAKKAMDEETL